MTINVGLIGYGMAGRIFHAPFITNEPCLHLTTVVTSDAAKVLWDYPAVQVVPTVSDVLADATIELIVIATPTTPMWISLDKLSSRGNMLSSISPYDAS